MNNFYKDKNVIVTGGAGMIGYQLVHQLVEAEANVIVLDDFSRGNNIVQGVQYEECDVSDYDTCIDKFYYADIVFNLAAVVGGVIFNQSHHLYMYTSNHAVQVAPVQAAVDNGVQHFLQTSSVCVYTDNRNSPAKEMFGHRGMLWKSANEGYSNSKRMGEMALLWSKIPHSVIVRPSNTYGVFDYFDKRAHVIPALIKKALDPGTDTIQVHGTGNEKREFIYSSDVATGMMIAMAKGNGIYNIGTHGKTCVTIKELVEKIQLACGTNKKVEFVYGNSGDNARWTDVSKLGALGFRHKIDLDTGLGLVVDWYREQL